MKTLISGFKYSLKISDPGGRVKISKLEHVLCEVQCEQCERSRVSIWERYVSFTVTFVLLAIGASNQPSASSE